MAKHLAPKSSKGISSLFSSGSVRNTEKKEKRPIFQKRKKDSDFYGESDEYEGYDEYDVSEESVVYEDDITSAEAEPALTEEGLPEEAYADAYDGEYAQSGWNTAPEAEYYDEAYGEYDETGYAEDGEDPSEYAYEDEWDEDSEEEDLPSNYEMVRVVLKDTVDTAGRLAAGVGQFFRSRRGGLAGVAKRNSFAEDIYFELSDAILAGAASVIAIVCIILRFYGLPAVLIAAAECLILARKLLPSVLEHICQLSFFHEGIVLMVAVIGAFCMGNPQNAVLILAAYTVAVYVRDYSGTVPEDEDDFELEDMPQVWKNEGSRKVPADIDTIRPGDEVLVDINCEVPFDGIVTKGTSKVDRHKLSRVVNPVAVGKDDFVYAGDLNQTGWLMIRVLKRRNESMIYDVASAREHCGKETSSRERSMASASEIASRILVFAGLVTIICSAFFPKLCGYIQNAGLCLLLLSCTGFDFLPNLYRRSLYNASIHGAVYTSKSVFDHIEHVDTVAFDKTGVLTDTTYDLIELRGADGRDRLTGIGKREMVADASELQKEISLEEEQEEENMRIYKDELLRWAAAAEEPSTHPIAKFLKATVDHGFPKERISLVSEDPGYGIVTSVDGHIVRVGNERMMMEQHIPVRTTKKSGIVCHVVRDSHYLGYIVLGEHVNPSTDECTESLKADGVSNLIMLTGTSASSAKAVARELSIDMIKYELLPEERVRTMEFLNRTKSAGAQVMYLNRGQNVFEAASKADISVTIAGLEENADIFSSDIYLFDNDISVIPDLVASARTATKLTRRNSMILYIGNGAALILGCMGLLPVGIYALIHFGVSAASYLNILKNTDF